MNQLTFGWTQDPDISAGCDDDALHQAKRAAKCDAFRRCQRLAVLVEYGDRLASVAGKPGVVFRIDGSAEGASLHPAAGKTGRNRGQWFSVRIELAGVALPQRILGLPANCEIIANPKVTLTVEHGLAASAIASAIKLQRQHPCTRWETEIRHEGHFAHRPAGRYRIEIVKQRKELLGLIPRIASNRLSRSERIGRSRARRRRRCCEEFVAAIRFETSDTGGKQVRQRCEVCHCGRLAAVERVLYCFAPAARLKIDKVRNVAGADL